MGGKNDGKGWSEGIRGYWGPERDIFLPKVAQADHRNQAHAHPWLLSGASAPQRVQLGAQGAEGWPVLRAGRPAQLHKLQNLTVGSTVGGA